MVVQAKACIAPENIEPKYSQPIFAISGLAVKKLFMKKAIDIPPTTAAITIFSTIR